MKKQYIIIILIVAVALIAIGIVGLAKSKDDTKEKISNATPEASHPGSLDYNGTASSASELMDVKMDSNVPSQIKDYEGFRVSFNSENKTPNWVSWELLGSETEGTLSRSNKFWTDSDLEGCPSTSDYTRSGYDRGHLCPAADQKWSQKAMEDCFVLANIAPQDHQLNTGAWNTLENKERSWAKRDSALVIVAGPIYSAPDTKTVGRAEVRVPGAFFKILLAPFQDEPRAIAFIYPNMYSPGNMEEYVVTVDEVEKITGFDFFSALPDDIENKIEASSSYKEWTRKK